MFEELNLNLEYGNAICYSGYREGQYPGGVYPSYDEIKEDLFILAKNWQYLRLYDCTPHAETVLQVIANEALHFKVMLGVDMAAEMSNPHCPWGADFSDETLVANRRANSKQIEKAIALSNRYPDIVFSVSVGNEASVEWTDHMVPVDSLVAHVLRMKSAIKQPITFCENYVPWTYKLEPLAEVLDVISIHTYPAWEYRSVHDALEYTMQNYHSVVDHYPGKPVVITEAGWTTASNGRGIEPHNASDSKHSTNRGKDHRIRWNRKSTGDCSILTVRPS
jgi:exo-beta-1,3-glucanase (GH17 family)